MSDIKKKTKENSSLFESFENKNEVCSSSFI